MNEAIEKRSRCQDDRAASKSPSVGENDGAYPVANDFKIGRFALYEFQSILSRNRSLHRLTVEAAVRLGSRTANSRPLPSVEKAKLNPGSVRNPAHQSIKRIDLSYEVAFTKSPYSGVA